MSSVLKLRKGNYIDFLLTLIVFRLVRCLIVVDMVCSRIQEWYIILSSKVAIPEKRKQEKITAGKVFQNTLN